MEENKKIMSDAELAEALGKIERMHFIGTVLVILSVIAGIAVGVISRDVRFGLAAFFVLIAAGILIGSSTAKKRRTLLHSQLGDFFASEFENSFGKDVIPDGYGISEADIRASEIIDYPFETCEIKNLHGGVFGGKVFSAANATLTHTFEENPGRDDNMTRTVNVLDGLYMVCETGIKLSSPVILRVKPSEFGAQYTSLDSRFEVASGVGEDVRRVFTEPLRTLCDELCGGSSPLLGGGSAIIGMVFTGGRLIIAANTHYAFADVSESRAVMNADEARAYYKESLEHMKKLLERINAYISAVSD